MTLSASPSDETLMRYAAGTLDPAIAVLVRVHLETSAESRTRLAEWDAVGGALLAGEAEAALTPGSLDRALAAIDRAAPPPASPPSPGAAPLHGTAALAGCEVGRWRWVAPGLRMAKVTPPATASARLLLMKIAPGTAMLDHGHEGEEITLVLSGAVEDGGERFGAGAFIEADASIQHQPVAAEGETCICLVAMDGHIRAPFPFGLIARHVMGF